MSGLAAYQGRVVAEQAELGLKLKALTAFTAGPVFPSLDAAERERLLRQLKAMIAYWDVLEERIKAFVVPSEFS